MQFPAARRRRRPSLTPMIDVVFLLLVFFMLAARFGTDTQIALKTGGQGGEWSGPPRLIALLPHAITLNGLPTDLASLPQALAPLMAAPSDPVILRPADDIPLQQLVTVMDTLRDAGLSTLILAE